MSKKIKLVNPLSVDWHVHTLNFSDGLSTIEEIVQFAGQIGLTELALTDHSDALRKLRGYNISLSCLIERWRNMHNDVKVKFGVEADLLNKEGDICTTIDGREPALINLSLHCPVFELNEQLQNITQAFCNALDRHHEKISCLCHLCTKRTRKFLNLEKVIKKANEYGIILEINGANLMNDKTDLDALKILLETTDHLTINSDAHTLYELKMARQVAFNQIKKLGFEVEA